MVGACNKNGVYYALRLDNLAAGPVWTFQAGNPENAGTGQCIAAAIWDGSRLFVASNGTTIGDVPSAVDLGADLVGSVRFRIGS